ncbi:hypothetical protein LP419_10380 [Massilia sp. H-1]|nr:hypothetical protein LP419_10380 [Massilia sp. H-1]
MSKRSSTERRQFMAAMGGLIAGAALPPAWPRRPPCRPAPPSPVPSLS